MPTLYTQPALFWGQRKRMGGGQLSRELGAWRLEQSGALGPWMPDWDSSEGPVIYSCSSGSLHLVGKLFLGKWDRLKRKQGEALRTPMGPIALPLFCSVPRHLHCRPELSLLLA